ncbi:Cell wall protein PRY3 [Echinococcus granulosus]|uniref:Cell wall protein PRY3 n=1 Tax=Echinococcus granulosus TaxID=6210 RepID=W6V649_ECHGR|nr:Cell wall protein PRY3 [Echinococcus granulosus]EUB61879.1 Cell wall protein PRY3 [Echinococcus granulosus]
MCISNNIVTTRRRTKLCNKASSNGSTSSGDLSERLRALHGCNPLNYDADLAEQAQKHAEFLALKRRMVHSNAFDYGENIAKKFGTPGFKLTGHFTQCVWSDTERAGFGFSKAREGDLVIVVGQYRPPGNYSGEFPSKVPRPLSGEPRVPSLEEISAKESRNATLLAYYDFRKD